MTGIFKNFFREASGAEVISPSKENRVETDNKEKRIISYPTDGKTVVGKIVRINREKGWGFISSKEVPFTRIFFHWTALKQTTLKFPELEKGMSVEFVPAEVEGEGTKALQIAVVKET